MRILSRHWKSSVSGRLLYREVRPARYSVLFHCILLYLLYFSPIKILSEFSKLFLKLNNVINILKNRLTLLSRFMAIYFNWFCPPDARSSFKYSFSSLFIPVSIDILDIATGLCRFKWLCSLHIVSILLIVVKLIIDDTTR